MTLEEQLVFKYVAMIRAAVDQFGEYQYFDKQLSEVMDLPTDEMMKLSIDDLAYVFQLVVDEEPEYGPRFVSSMLVEMQEYEDFDQLISKYDWLDDLF